MIEVTNVTKEIEGKLILNDITFKIKDLSGIRIGLVGHNGVGKTTLLRLISGQDEDYKGKICIGKSTNVGCVEQEILLDEESLSIKDYIYIKTGIKDLEERIMFLENNLENEGLIEEYGEILQKCISLDGYNIEYNIQKLLAGLNLKKDIESTRMKELSGGEKKKVLLSTVFIKGTDILLLDEPTNDLDLNAILWVEDYLKNNQASMIIVSHDRKFLDGVTNKIWEIGHEKRTITEYGGNYSDYITHKQKLLNGQIQEYEKTQEEIGRLNNSANRKKNWAVSGRAQGVNDNDKYTKGYERNKSGKLGSGAKNIEKKISKLEDVEKPKTRKPFIINIKDSDRKTSEYIFEMNNIIIGYENGFEIGPITLNVEYGEKIVILGENGSGKTTLLKAMCYDENIISGEVRQTKNFINLIQEHNALQEEAATLVQYIVENSKVTREEAINLIVKAQFNRDEINKRMSDISPGERVRMILTSFSGKEIDAIILDEPTNHLDLEGIKVLEEVVNDFKGSVVLVSHDREFLSNIESLQCYTLEGNHLIKKKELNDEIDMNV